MPGKILLAEDDANLRETLTEVFEAEGWEVIAVVNGQAAVELLSNPETAQVIVLDALLPKMNGFDVAKTVRNLGRETPIFFMSGVFRSQEQQREAREKYGCRAYLTKPFDPKHLVDAIRPLLAGDVVAAVAPVAAPQQVQQPQEPLPLLGTLLEYPPLYLLWRAALESHTGVLELFAERERARVFVVKGRAVFAQHSDAQLNVGVELVRDGALTAESYTQACATAIKSSSGLLDVLKSEYGCTEVQTRAAYKALVPKILERVVALSGNFRFVQTDQFSSIVPAASVSIIEPLLSGLRAATVHALDPHVGPRRPLRLAPGDFWGDVVGKLADGCGSESLAKAINGRATIAQLLEAAPNPVEKAARYRQVYLLMSTRAVRASLDPMALATPVVTAPERPLPQSDSPRPVVATPVARATPGFAATSAPPKGASAPPQARANAAEVQGANARPVIDESGDRHVRFTPEEEAARGKLNAKFEEIIGLDYFAVLGVKRSVDATTLKRAYFTLAKDFHTDSFAGLNIGSAKQKLDHIFHVIQAAHTTLIDANRRSEYEASLSFKDSGGSTDVAAILQAETDLFKVKVLIERGELTAALRILDKVIVVMPKSDEVLGLQRFCLWYHTKNHSTARATVLALELHFRSAPGALSLKEFQGCIWMEVGEIKAARIAFKHVLDLDPSHPGATRGNRQLQRKVEEDAKNASSGLGRFLKR